MGDINFHWYDVISIAGVVIILVTYFLLQCDKMRPDSYFYSFLNLLGSLMILFSLMYEWNLSAVTIEIFWALISIIGLARRFLKR